MSRADIRSEVTAGRWSTAGRHTVVIGTGIPAGEGRWWHALWETGAGAALDGVRATIRAAPWARTDRSAALQAVRTGPGGRVYLDVAWEDIGLVVEIDGGHHALARSTRCLHGQVARAHDQQARRRAA